MVFFKTDIVIKYILPISLIASGAPVFYFIYKNNNSNTTPHGIQRSQGIQRNQGFQRDQSNQGFQGIQRNQRFQGTQGTQGTQGFLGNQDVQRNMINNNSLSITQQINKNSNQFQKNESLNQSQKQKNQVSKNGYKNILHDKTILKNLSFNKNNNNNLSVILEENFEGEGEEEDNESEEYNKLQKIYDAMNQNNEIDNKIDNKIDNCSDILDLTCEIVRKINNTSRNKLKLSQLNKQMELIINLKNKMIEIDQNKENKSKIKEIEEQIDCLMEVYIDLSESIEAKEKDSKERDYEYRKLQSIYETIIRNKIVNYETCNRIIFLIRGMIGKMRTSKNELEEKSFLKNLKNKLDSEILQIKEHITQQIILIKNLKNKIEINQEKYKDTIIAIAVQIKCLEGINTNKLLRRNSY